jgi:hypothetical protein
VALKNIRNIAIIMLVALAITVLPGGGDFAAGVWAILALCFLMAIASVGFRLYKDSQLTLWSMTWQHRLMLYGGLAVLFMALAATSALWSTGTGLIIWIGLIVGGGFTVFTALNESRKYRI